MTSYRARNGSIVELFEAMHTGQVRGLTEKDRWLAREFYNDVHYFPYDDSCLVYLPLLETSGQLAHDYSRNDHNGTIYGTTVVDGVLNKARHFDGIDDYIECLNYKPTVTAGFTVSVWFKTTESQIMDIADQWGAAGSGYASWVIVMLSDGRVQGSVYNGSSGYPIVTTGSYNDGDFHHAALVFSPNTLELYMDGDSIDSRTAYVQNSNQYNIRLGREGTGGKLFKGDIDEFRLYNRALSSTEIQCLASQG